jgi:hypothetical protein
MAAAKPRSIPEKTIHRVPTSHKPEASVLKLRIS